MRFIILTFLSLISMTIYSQDLIILRNGEQIDCKITKVEGSIIHYDFYKGERKLSSYVVKEDVHSYKINATGNVPDNSSDMLQNQENTVIIVTTRYVKQTNQWINLITYAQRYGLHADGWSVQYNGYNLKNTSKWTIPILIGLEGFRINTDYFSQFNYQSVTMSYYMVGISPFYRLNGYLFLKLGANLIFGEEELTDFYGRDSSHTFFGISPSQGIYFIPKAKAGFTLGLSVYEKLLSSKVYKNDMGLKFEIGIKF